MAKKNICFLASNANRTVKLAKMAKISQVWHLWIQYQILIYRLKIQNCKKQIHKYTSPLTVLLSTTIISFAWPLLLPATTVILRISKRRYTPTLPINFFSLLLESSSVIYILTRNSLFFVRFQINNNGKTL